MIRAQLHGPAPLSCCTARLLNRVSPYLREIHGRDRKGRARGRGAAAPDGRGRVSGQIPAELAEAKRPLSSNSSNSSNTCEIKYSCLE